MPLRLGTRLRAFGFQTLVLSIGLQLPCLDAIVLKARKHFIDDPIAQRRIFDGERQFNATVKIWRHPIWTGGANLGLSGILKIKIPAVLKKATDNAADM